MNFYSTLGDSPDYRNIFWTWPVNPIVHEHLSRLTPEAACSRVELSRTFLEAA